MREGGGSKAGKMKGEMIKRINFVACSHIFESASYN